jgi:metal-responsive CopG/Arc/MetJ family transcriptional regulator
LSITLHTEMATIQVVIEDRLLRAADRMAKKRQVNRSALFREALRAYLKNAHFRDLERREREAYERTPEDPSEVALWEGVAAWPEE